MSWKISRIEISSFKVFKKITLDISDTSIITLDGPNGFGKTSIFDAIELLFTAEIYRVKQLCSRVMNQKIKKYEDNLFWNKNSLDSDLYIKIEFKKNDSTLVLARRASSKAHENPLNNKSDHFDCFKLYKLDSFESNDYSNESILDERYINQEFGNNFKDNYCLLNYLPQGQNEYLYSKRVDTRKSELENLMQTTVIKGEIEKCKSIEKKITKKYINNPEKSEELNGLNNEKRLFQELLQDNTEEIEYERLSTSEIQPLWDKENLPTTYNKAEYDEFLTKVKLLLELVPLKKSIEIRLENQKIENFIKNENQLLELLSRTGNEFNKLENLNTIKEKLDNLEVIKKILQKDAKDITFNEVSQTNRFDLEVLDELKSKIINRDRLLDKVTNFKARISEIIILSNELTSKHFELFPQEDNCPLCGTNWQTHQQLIKALNKRESILKSSLDSNTLELDKILRFIKSNQDSKLTEVSEDIESLKLNYNYDLHSILIDNNHKLELLNKLKIRLEKQQITYPVEFTNDDNKVNKRLNSLIVNIKNLKVIEQESLPGDWQDIIDSTFKVPKDFFDIRQDQIEQKIKYIKQKREKAKSSRLKQIDQRIKKLSSELQAAESIKSKVKKLRKLLEDVEKNYSDKTISDIELIFHIYSGRLIQNYQRGLGLFIESKDGRELKFTTAEKSQHDSVLSMSSGQLSAVSLAFLFALHKVYATTQIIMIDDPTQTLDEINIASLTDLMRCEFKDNQFIISSHEEDVSSYVRYKFKKAGLSSKSINVQNLQD